MNDITNPTEQLRDKNGPYLIVEVKNRHGQCHLHFYKWDEILQYMKDNNKRLSELFLNLRQFVHDAKCDIQNELSVYDLINGYVSSGKFVDKQVQQLYCCNVTEYTEEMRRNIVANARIGHNKYGLIFIDTSVVEPTTELRYIRIGSVEVHDTQRFFDTKFVCLSKIDGNCFDNFMAFSIVPMLTEMTRIARQSADKTVQRRELTDYRTSGLYEEDWSRLREMQNLLSKAIAKIDDMRYHLCII